MTTMARTHDTKAGVGFSRGYYVGLVGMVLLYVASGVNHLLHPATYMTVMPPYIPSPLAMIYISGAAEILGGTGMLIPNGFVFPRTRSLAAWGIIILLMAIWPVHFNMCLHPEQFPAIPVWVMWVRLPLQLPLMLWAWIYTKR